MATDTHPLTSCELRDILPTAPSVIWQKTNVNSCFMAAIFVIADWGTVFFYNLNVRVFNKRDLAPRNYSFDPSITKFRSQDEPLK